MLRSAVQPAPAIPIKVYSTFFFFGTVLVRTTHSLVGFFAGKRCVACTLAHCDPHVASHPTSLLARFLRLLGLPGVGGWVWAFSRWRSLQVPLSRNVPEMPGVIFSDNGRSNMPKVEDIMQVRRR